MDKSQKLNVTLESVNQGVRFEGSAEGQQPVHIDYIPPLGEGLGYTSLELLLLSLASCMATSLVTFLRRSGKTVSGLRVGAEADRRPEHPTILTRIHLRFYLTSPDILQADFEKVLALTEEKYCPVFAMINPQTRIISTCHIESGN
jgi:putative redox protein